MGKKTSKIVQFKKGKFIKNISSIKKSKELNNKYKQLQIKKRLKKSKNNSFSHNSSIKKYKKKTNHSNNNFNNINFNDNPFIFNFIFNNKNTNEKPEWMSQTTEKIENIDIDGIVDSSTLAYLIDGENKTTFKSPSNSVAFLILLPFMATIVLTEITK